MYSSLRKWLVLVSAVCLLFNAAYLARAARRVPAPEPSPVASMVPIAGPTEAPKFSPEKGGHDFGEIGQGEKHETVMRFHNNGFATLKIGKLETSCGCTAALLSKEELAPGEEAEIRVEFDSGTRRGRFRKLVSVHSNAPGSPHHLYVEGTIRPTGGVEPERLYYDELVGEGKEITIFLTDPKEEFRLLKVTQGLPSLKIDGFRPDTPPQNTFKLRVRLPGEPPRNPAGMAVYTDHPKLPRIVVPILHRRSR